MFSPCATNFKMADEEEENLVLVVNCSKKTSSEDIITQIIQSELLPSHQVSSEPYCIPWSIENKYYSADVEFLVLKDLDPCTGCDKIQGKNVNAFLVIFDQTETSFELVKNWLPYIESQEASVLLLIKSKQESKVDGDLKDESQELTRVQVVEWCIEHSFEFIDLNEEVDPEDDFPDTVGVARVVQALQTTEWHCLQLKELSIRELGPSSALIITDCHQIDANFYTRIFSYLFARAMFNECSNKGNVSAAGSNKCSLTQSNDESHPKADEKKTYFDGSSSTSAFKEGHTFMNDVEKFDDILDGVADAELDDEASFEQLFSRMHFMKEKAQSLPHEERKAYAEQVAMAFWRAIGGDEEDVEGLDENKD